MEKSCFSLRAPWGRDGYARRPAPRVPQTGHDRSSGELIRLAIFVGEVTIGRLVVGESFGLGVPFQVVLQPMRDIADQKKASFSIVTEMLDPRNSKLAAVTRADDFIVSNRLVSLMMSQVAESKMINSVFNDLFDPAGSEIYLKPVKKYVQPGEEVNFYTLVEAAQRRGEVAIGYRLEAQSKDANSAYGVVLNPPKAEKVIFGREDKLIVLAEG